jgi:excisionase family DNA binding protein
MDMSNHMTGEPMRHTPTMTSAEASAVLNVSRNTLYSWARRGHIRAYRDKGQWRYLRSDIHELAARVDAHPPSRRTKAVERMSSASDDMPANSWPEQL